jgi:hypothetical protein
VRPGDSLLNVYNDAALGARLGRIVYLGVLLFLPSIVRQLRLLELLRLIEMIVGPVRWL